MSSVNTEITFSCPRCQHLIKGWSRPIINVQTDIEKYKAFLNDRLNPKVCSSCELPVDFATPTAILGQHWVGIALENPDPIPVFMAFEIVQALLQEVLNLDLIPAKPILVMHNSDELRRIILNNSGDPFCFVRMDTLLLRNFAVFVEMLAALSDAYLELNFPEWAYWVWSEIVGLYNELYFQPRVFELIELTTIAAGNKVAKGLRVPRTALADFDFMKSELEPYRIKHPEWWRSAFFCFYERGPHPQWMKKSAHLWSTVVDRVGLAQDGSFDPTKAERHQVAVPVQSVYQEELQDLEQASIYMLILMLIGRAQGILPELPRDVLSVSRYCQMWFNMKWFEINHEEQRELEKIYRQLTNGRELRLDFEQLLLNRPFHS